MSGGRATQEHQDEKSAAASVSSIGYSRVYSYVQAMLRIPIRDRQLTHERRVQTGVPNARIPGAATSAS